MKEHNRVKSTKPMQSTVPGEVTVGDIMFVELKDNRKQPLLIHTDVCLLEKNWRVKPPKN